MSYPPTDTALDLLSVIHVYKTTAGWGVYLVFGAEVRVIDVSGDEVSDDRRHSVYRGSFVSRVPRFGEGIINVHWVSRKTELSMRCGHSNTLHSSWISSCP